CAVGFACLVAHAAFAAPARWHFAFGRAWEISILFERHEAGDRTRLLVRSPAGRFVFFSEQDPSGRDSTESIRRLPDGETLTRRLVLSRFGDVPGCEKVVPPDACVVFEGKGGTLAAGFSAFSDERAATTRERAASLVSPAMRDALFGATPILPAVAEFGSYTKDFLGLVWPERFTKSQSLKKGERTKGCDFDATFGYPCDADARRREEKQFAAR
ncbi:MAG: hypothetical protein ACXVH0_08985, partial [Thermoanaerobaculia bacterium]